MDAKESEVNEKPAENGEAPKGLTMPKTMTVEVPVSIGVQNVLEVVQFGSALAKAIEEAKNNDGKIDMKDISLLLPVAPMIIPMIKGIDQVPKELGDLDAQELAVLMAAVESQLGQTGPRTVLRIKAAINFAHAGYDLYRAFA